MRSSGRFSNKSLIAMIKKIFLLLCLVLIGVCGYFYFFPMYQGNDISEEYFKTRFQDRWFDVPENGFQDFQSGVKGLEEYRELLWEFDLYYRCFIEGDCLEELQGLSEAQKEEELQNIVNDKEKFSNFQKLSNVFLDDMEWVFQEHDFISTLDYENYSKMLRGEETKPLMTYTQMIQFTWALRFYYQYSSNKEVIAVFTRFYKIMSELSTKMDGGVLEYLVFITTLDIQLEFILENYERFDVIEKRILWNILKKYKISSDMIENGIRWEYQKELMMYEFGSRELWKEGMNFKTLLLYDHEETLEILQEVAYEAIQWNCENVIWLNGRNFIWRTLIKWPGGCIYVSQIKKQETLLEKYNEVIQLLSN